MMHLVMIETDSEQQEVDLHELLAKAIHELDQEALLALQKAVLDIRLIAGD
jgi:hypothetical protein